MRSDTCTWGHKQLKRYRNQLSGLTRPVCKVTEKVEFEELDKEMYPKYMQNNIQDIQDIQDKYKIPSGSRPCPSRGRAGADPGPRDPGLGPGLGRAWARPGRWALGILYLSWSILNIFGYILVSFSYIFWYSETAGRSVFN